MTSYYQKQNKSKPEEQERKKAKIRQMLPQTQFLNLQHTESNKLYFDELRNPELLFQAGDSEKPQTDTNLYRKKKFQEITIAEA